MTSVEAVVERCGTMDPAELGRAVASLAALGGLTVEQAGFDVCRRLLALRGSEEAAQFLVRLCANDENGGSRLLAYGEGLQAAGEASAAAAVLTAYVEAGGKAVSAYQVCLDFAISQASSSAVSGLIDRTPVEILRELRADSLFNAGCALIRMERFSDAADLFLLNLEQNPDHKISEDNLGYLAQEHMAPRAVDFFVTKVKQIATLFPAYRENRLGAVAPAALDWEPGLLEEIVESVNQNGFCHLRNACSMAAVAALLDQALAFEATATIFPVSMSEFTQGPIDHLYRFDAQAIVGRLLLKDARFDPTASTLRRVSPEREQSGLPFHQDTTAFRKMIANIWTPLTPAGGDYPTLKLIKKRIKIMEQIILKRAFHNLIEIEADLVTRKYGDLIHEIAQAAPGDCVIFLGTTIHASHIPPGASKTRFSAEVRWS